MRDFHMKAHHTMSVTSVSIRIYKSDSLNKHESLNWLIWEALLKLVMACIRTLFF